MRKFVQRGLSSLHFPAGNGLPTAERVGTNGPLSYLASDGQGTVSEALDSAGSVTFAQLYTPYGAARYSSGSSPTTLGYTGQRADGTTGLDYYHARYYDPVAGQFGSADTVNDGLNRYGYVHGNPESHTDPTGHRCYNGDGGVCGSPGSSPPPPSGSTNAGSPFDGICNQYQCPPPPGGGHSSDGGCHSDATCGCYENCGPAPVQPATSDDVNACYTAGSPHPAWCSRYVSYYNSDGSVLQTSDILDTADYYFLEVSAGDGGGVQIVYYYIRALGIWMDSLGVFYGASLSLLGLFVLGAGAGQLMAKGTPTGEQVSDFLSGVSHSASVGAIFISGSSVTSVLSPFTALQYGLSTAAVAAATGVSYGAPYQGQCWAIGPIYIPSCVWDEH